MPDNEIYKFLKENNLTDKDEATFLEEYSNPEKAKELYGFFQENNLTTKTDVEFYDSYLKKKVGAEPTQPDLGSGGTVGDSKTQFTEGKGLFSPFDFSNKVEDLKSKEIQGASYGLSIGENQKEVTKDEFLDFLSIPENLNKLKKGEMNAVVNGDKETQDFFEQSVKGFETQSPPQETKEPSALKDFAKSVYNSFIDATTGVSKFLTQAGSLQEDASLFDKEAITSTEYDVENRKQKIEETLGQFKKETSKEFNDAQPSDIFKGNKFAIAKISAEIVPSVVGVLASFTPAAPVAAPATVSYFFGRSYDAAQDKLKDVDMPQSSKELYSISLGGIEAGWEALNVGKFIKLPQVVKDKLIKTAANELAQKLIKQGGKITDDIVRQETQSSLKKMGKVAVAMAKSSVNPTISETVEETGVATTQLGMDALIDSQYGTKLVVENPLSDIYESAVGGGAGGLLMSVVLAPFGISGRKYRTITERISADNSAPNILAVTEEFNKQLQSDIASGNITQEEANQATNGFNELIDIARGVPNFIKDKETRAIAMDVVGDRREVQKMIENTLQQSKSVDEAFKPLYEKEIARLEKEKQALSQYLIDGIGKSKRKSLNDIEYESLLNRPQDVQSKDEEINKGANEINEEIEKQKQAVLDLIADKDGNEIPTTAQEDVEAKKAEIERRRQEELKRKDNYEYPEGHTSIPRESWKDVMEEDKKQINAKYDAELKALDQAQAKPISETETTENVALSDVESTAKALEDKKSSLDEKAKKLGYIGIKQFNAQNQLNENLTDAEKALLQEYSDFQQEIKNLKDENVIAKLSDDEFSSWSKANDITRDDLGKVVKDEEIELAAKRIRILNARGDSKKAESELKKLKESKKKDNWTIESWKERFDEDVEQSEIDDINSSNKEFNKSIDKAVESLLSKEQPKIETNAKEQQSGQMREQGVQDQPQRESDSNMPIVNEAELQDREVVEEEVKGKYTTTTATNTDNVKVGEKFYGNYAGVIRLVEKIESRKDNKGFEVIRVKTEDGIVFEHYNNDPINPSLQKYKEEVKGKEIAPNKEVSVSQAKAIKDVTTNLNTDLKDMEATMLFSKFRDNVDEQIEVGEGLTKKQFESLENKGYVEQPSSFKDEYVLTEKGKQFIDRVKTRIETRRGVKLGTDMFPELANIPEFKPIQETIQKEIDNGTITEETVEEYGNKSDEEITSNEAVVEDIERKAESDNEVELNEAIKQSNQVTGRTDLTINDIERVNNKHFIWDFSNAELVEVKGKDIELEADINGDYFTAKYGNGFGVYEAKTGLRIADAKTQKEAIKNSNDKIKNYGLDKTIEAMNSSINKTGISPRYKIKEQPTPTTKPLETKEKSPIKVKFNFAGGVFEGTVTGEEQGKLKVLGNDGTKYTVDKKDVISEAIPEQSPEEIAKRIRDKKQGGALSSIDFGISKVLYNGALEFMAKQVESGTKLGNAIANTIKWIDARMDGKKWDKGAFGKYMNDTYTMKLNDGRTVEVVRDDTKETAQLINGFYSDIEQKLLDTKKQSGSANEWKSIVGEGDESKFTGLIDWLSNQQGSVSKTDIQKYLKDNRIEVVEVVKGELSKKESEERDRLLEELNDIGAKKTLALLNGDTIKRNELEIKENELFNKLKPLSDRTNNTLTKFTQYQLEGEKENYKEVLVTMPKKKVKVDGFEISETDTVIYEDRGMGKPLKVIKVIPKKFTEASNEASKYISDNSYKYEYNLDYNDGESVIDALKKGGVKIDETNFESSHFEEPNILVHLRMNTRTDADGNKVLFIEEFQRDVEKETNLGEKEAGLPFSKTTDYVKLAWKVALKEAVKQGVDKIAWTTGEQQNDRYDLSKQVDRVTWEYEKGLSKDIGTVTLYKDGKEVGGETIPTSKLPDVIGKELAKKILEQEEKQSDFNKYYNQKELRGKGLQVGGSGMKGFYGSPTEGSLGIVGNVAKSLFKQEPKTIKIVERKKDFDGYVIDKNDDGTYNVGIKNEDLYGDPDNGFETAEKAKQFAENRIKEINQENPPLTTEQYSIDITPELKASVEKGLPLFGNINTQIQEAKDNLSNLINQGKNIGIAFDPKREAERQFNIHKALVTLAKLYIQKGILTAQDFANEVGLKLQDISKAWNEANGGKELTKEDLVKDPYDVDAIREGLGNEQKQKEYLLKIEKAKKSLDENLNKINKLFDKPKDKNDDVIFSQLIPKSIFGLPFRAVDLAEKYVYEKVVVPVGDAAAKALRKGMESSNTYLNEASTQVQALIRTAPLTTEEITARRRSIGEINSAIFRALRFYQNAVNSIGKDAQSLRNIHMVLDPQVYEKMGETPKEYNDLNDTEKNLHDLLRATNDAIHDWHFINGKIDEETYEQNKGKYIARFYEEIEFEDAPSAFKKSFTDMSKQMNFGYVKERKELDEITLKSLEDPVYATARRLGQMLKNQAVIDYANQAFTKVKTFAEGDTNIPNNYVKLEGGGEFGNIKVWGDLTNRYVPIDLAEDLKGYMFLSDASQKAYDFNKAYDRLSIRQFYKKLNTVYNPLVHVGNAVSNFSFSFWTGIDPIGLISNIPQAAQEVRENGDIFLELAREGVVVSDVVTKDLTKSSKDILARTQNANASSNAFRRVFDKFDEFVTDKYANTDDIAKVAAYITLTKDYKVPPKEASKRVFDGFQNYAQVGRLYDFASKTPIIGNPYVKFKADLLRIIKNGVLRKPLTMIGYMMLLKGFADLMSNLADEDEEDRRLREARAFIPKIPMPNALGGDIPLVFQTKYGEVNAARYFSPFYIYDDANKSGTLEKASQFSPVSLKQYRDRPIPLPAINDVLFGSLVQAVINEDFRGKRIQDPSGTRFQEGVESSEERLVNSLNYIARQQVPFYSKTQDLINALNGDPDFYGRNKDLTQSLISSVIKIEQMNASDIKENVRKNVEFAMKDLQALEALKKKANREYKEKAGEIEKSSKSQERKEEAIRKQLDILTDRLAELTDKQAKIKSDLLSSTGKEIELKNKKSSSGLPKQNIGGLPKQDLK